MSKTKTVRAPPRRHAIATTALLDRILDTPHLAHAVPRLQPEVLHRVIQSCGLEACGEIVALATPDQLARVFDLDLWRPGQPGLDDRLDADRFGLWLEVLMEAGPAVAAQTVAGMDVDLVIAALAQHVLVFDRAAVSPAAPADGEEAAAVGPPGEGLRSDVGGYLAQAKRTDSWDAIVAVLVALDESHHDYFHRVMRGCRTLSNSTPEADGLHDLLGDSAQVTFNVAFDRERRREQLGYVTPAQARAFLQMSRQLRRGRDATPPDSPVSRAYFRALDWTTAAEANVVSRRLHEGLGTPPDPEDSARAVAAVVDVLLDAGVLTRPPHALLDGPEGEAPRLARIQAHMQHARACDPAAYATRSQELAYLANTIMAGCSIQSRAFTAQEASDAAVATCNLGLENWPRHWIAATGPRRTSAAGTGPLPDDFLVGHDLVTVFQVGWTVLHDDVCQYAAKRLIGVLAGLRCEDRDIQAGLNALRIGMAKQWRAGAPWQAREALDVIMPLDMPAWATLAGLIAECPAIHAGIGASRGAATHAVSASAFEFIAENRQVASVRAFMQSLPDTLRA